MFKPVDNQVSLPKLEEEVLKFWQENDSFAKSLKQRENCEEYVFYDGPPFATGMLQKALAKVEPRIAEGGLVICEHPFKEEMPEIQGGLVKQREYKYSKTAVTVYRKG